MRLFTKIFLCGTFVLSLAFSISGYFLLHFSWESSMAREADFALKQYQYDKFTIQSALLTSTDFELTFVIAQENPGAQGQITTWWGDFPGYRATSEKVDGGETWSVREAEKLVPQESAEEMFQILAQEVSLPAAFFTQDKVLLYSGIEALDVSFLDHLSGESHAYQFQETSEGSFLLVGSVLACERPSLTSVTEESGQGAMEAEKEAQDQIWYEAEDTTQDLVAAGEKIYFVTQWDVSKTVRQQEILQQYFLRCYFVAISVGMALLGLLSAFLTGPLKNMSLAARRIAQGDYEERLAISGKDEIGELAESFNQMAEAVEEKVEALSAAAREREDFVANFAHEMKTPMTSIVGYADMLYQKELSRKEVRDASWYIWNEGMRLEALSFKLMDLTVLGRQDFSLQEMAADELLADVAGGLEPLFSEKGISFELSADPAYIRVEYDLLKTLLVNLLDNSIKAGCTRLELSGRQTGDQEYQICVRDNGCGMEEEELSRITEAFYMVDKARSRKQHGAGLGLALADRIAKIHGSKLEFQSKKGEGTEVKLGFSCVKIGMEDEE